MTAQTHGSPSSAQLASQLVVEFALANIAGVAEGRAPVTAVRLSAAERKSISLEDGGETYLFPLSKEQVVLMDWADNQCVIWFAGADAQAASSVLHELLLAQYPQAEVLEENQHPEDPRMQARAYSILLNEQRLALVNTTYSTTGKGQTRFSIRVSAHQRVN